MAQVIPKPPQLHLITFEEFLEQYPEDGGRYELIDGKVLPVRTKGQHGLMGGYLALELGLQIRLNHLNLCIPKEHCIKPNLPYNGYDPDVAVLKADALAQEPLWAEASTITQGTSVALFVEVVSTNWRDDYRRKWIAYEQLGIPEYWIVDYKPFATSIVQQPTLTLCTWVNGKYQQQPFCGDDEIISPTFPDLKLKAKQVFKASF
jgi:Uma2 family endonuclease